MQEHASLTDVGRTRDHNEDALAVVPLIDGLMCAIADGMGGHAAGEVASALAIEGIRQAGRRVRRGEPAMALLESAVSQSHQAIRRAAQNGREGMGCTITAAAIRPGHVEVIQIGDSRAYRVRAGAIEQLTEDDSLVGEMLRQGLLTEAEARAHPARSVLTRALGIGEEADYTTREADLQDGDVLVFCSDGLTTHVKDAEIAELITGAKNLKVAAQALIDTANEGGGSDNISVVLVRCQGKRR